MLRKMSAMGACRVDVSPSLQVGFASECEVEPRRRVCVGFSRIVGVGVVRVERLGCGVWSGFGVEGLGGSQMATARGDFAVAASTSTSPTREAAERQKEAAELVREFYAAINRREIVQIGDLFAEDCVYEDLVFPKPFVGRKAITEFFQKFMNSVGSELEFKVDDITTGDPNAAGVIWHLEWKGKPFPFGKGCSFYRCDVFDGKRQIVYGRDAVEPATKPGDFTLVALKGLAALLRRFPSLADRF